jgi:hypothetical protein
MYVSRRLLRVQARREVVRMAVIVALNVSKPGVASRSVSRRLYNPDASTNSGVDCVDANLAHRLDTLKFSLFPLAQLPPN